MSGAIAVFVKTPRFSLVKTRLANTLGKKTAEAFHLAAARSVSSVIQELGRLTDIQGYYAVAEQAALNNDHWQDLPCLWQGEGGLGERMAHIYQTLLTQYDFVILVGADIPQMTTPDLLMATSWLSYTEEQARLIFAPSIDGGFWAVGGNVNIAQDIWTDVVYSMADTGAQFFSKIEHLGKIKILPTLRDVDEASDLLALRDTLLNLPNPSPEQYELLRFLDVLPVKFFSD